MRFFVGVHRPRMGWPLSLRGHPVCISANVLAGRTGNVAFVGQSEGWMLDSGAFTQIALRGRFGKSPQDYAALVRQFGDWHGSGLEVAVSQDWMCEPDVIAATGLSVREHQQLTLDRFDAIGVILETILRTRPDLRLHGFGVKLTALQSPAVRSMLYSADSMAWSYAARRSGRDQNDWMEAYLFAERIAGRSRPMAGGAQPSLF